MNVLVNVTFNRENTVIADSGDQQKTSFFGSVMSIVRPVPRERLEAMDWRHKSACRDEDPELFFPIGNTGPALAQIEEAKKVCNRCDVKDACLAWALESGQDAGVWGGLSEDERRAMKRRAARNRARQLENQNRF